MSAPDEATLAKKWPRLHSSMRAWRDRFPGFAPEQHPKDGMRPALARLMPKALDPKVIEQFIVQVAHKDGTKIPVTVFRPATFTKGQSLATLLWGHGGGFVAGTPGNDHNLIEQIVNHGYLVLSVDYRLAPEIPFPAAIDDFSLCYEWTASAEAKELGVDISRFMLGGSSAGGNLAAVMSLRINKSPSTTRPAPRLILLDVPALDDRSDLYHSMDESNPLSSNQILPRIVSNTCEKHYLQEAYGNATLDFAVNKATKEELKGSPAHFIVYAEHDCLRDHSHAYIGKLLEADVRVGSVLGSGCFHSYVRLMPGSEPSRLATLLILDAMKEAVAP